MSFLSRLMDRVFGPDTCNCAAYAWGCDLCDPIKGKHQA